MLYLLNYVNKHMSMYSNFIFLILHKVFEFNIRVTGQLISWEQLLENNSQRIIELLLQNFSMIVCVHILYIYLLSNTSVWHHSGLQRNRMRAYC